MSEVALPPVPSSDGREGDLLRRVIEALVADRILPDHLARDLRADLADLQRHARQARDAVTDEVVRCPHCAGPVVVAVARRVRRTQSHPCGLR